MATFETFRYDYNTTRSAFIPSRLSSMDSNMGQRPNVSYSLPVDISKKDIQQRSSKGSKLPIQENRHELFLIGFEIFLCENGRFNIETLRAGKILTPKRPIAAKRYWLALVSSARPRLPSRLPFPSSPAAQCARFLPHRSLLQPSLSPLTLARQERGGGDIATPMIFFMKWAPNCWVDCAEILQS